MTRSSKPPKTLAVAVLFTGAVVALGFVMLGLLPMLLFALGFFVGLVLWIFSPTQTPFSRFQLPYFLGLAVFIVHKLEERYFDFFPALAEITGVPVPPTNSPPVYALYALAACWLLVPWLTSRGKEFGYFLAWTFFASLGITELAHFVFPLLKEGSYEYFPGMASVVLLAPTAWWGMWRLRR